jgi:hypothetical protein
MERGHTLRCRHAFYTQMYIYTNKSDNMQNPHSGKDMLGVSLEEKEKIMHAGSK